MRRHDLPEEPETLQVGELWYCERCLDRHVMESTPQDGPSPYARDMLFVLCQNGKRYYVGQIGFPGNWRSPLRWD